MLKWDTFLIYVHSNPSSGVHRITYQFAAVFSSPLAVSITSNFFGFIAFMYRLYIQLQYARITTYFDMIQC